MNKVAQLVKGVVMDWAGAKRPFMVDDRNTNKWVMVDGNTTALVEHVCTEVFSGITDEYTVAEVVDTVNEYLDRCEAKTYSNMETHFINVHKENGSDEVDLYGYTFSKIELLQQNDPTAFREMLLTYCDSIARG